MELFPTELSWLNLPCLDEPKMWTSLFFYTIRRKYIYLFTLGSLQPFQLSSSLRTAQSRQDSNVNSWIHDFSSLKPLSPQCLSNESPAADDELGWFSTRSLWLKSPDFGKYNALRHNKQGRHLCCFGANDLKIVGNEDYAKQ